MNTVPSPMPAGELSVTEKFQKKCMNIASPRPSKRSGTSSSDLPNFV